MGIIVPLTVCSCHPVQCPEIVITVYTMIFQKILFLYLAPYVGWGEILGGGVSNFAYT